MITLLTVAASVVSLVLAYQEWFPSATSEGKLAIIVLTSFTLLLSFTVALQRFRFSRRAAYGDASRRLNRVFFEIVDASQRGTSSAAHIKAACQESVNALAEVFTRITGSRCSACIKIVEGDFGTGLGDDTRLKVVTLCRDTESDQARRRPGKNQDWIDQNSDFEELFAQRSAKRFFASNSLPWLSDYKNTSFEVYGMPPRLGVPILGQIVRDLLWPLPYRSTIVVPISPKADDDQVRAFRVGGYFCVDSTSRFVFSTRMDVELVRGVADCLHPIVSRYCSLRSGSYRGKKQ